MFVDISAKQNLGIDDLLETILFTGRMSWKLKGKRTPLLLVMFLRS